jgi:hypothetical protein
MTESIETVAIDPETDKPFPAWLDDDALARYLLAVHGLPLQKRRIRNRRAAGGNVPRCKYQGHIPFTHRTEADRWAMHSALTDESPLSRKAQRGVEIAANMR